MKTLLSGLFQGIVALRNAAYNRGILRVHHIPVPVISIGNITVGGTGKTPLVERLVEYFLEHSVKVAVVTRGYKRKTKGTVVVSDGRGSVRTVDEGGDEPVQMARKFPKLVVVADKCRVRGCRLAVSRFKVDIIILDDGYQHRACSRDLDIVVIDASQKLWDQQLLPIGRLREPLKNLSRADVVVLSKCEPKVSYEQLALSLNAYTLVPVVTTQFTPISLRRLGDEEILPQDFLREKDVISFCGIGSPQTFRKTIAMLRANSVLHTDYPDHYEYSRRSIEALVDSARSLGVKDFLTTEKDAIRLESMLPLFREYALYYPHMRVEFLSQQELFFSTIQRTMRGKRSR